jgi:hypothetical protein
LGDPEGGGTITPKTEIRLKALEELTLSELGRYAFSCAAAR